MLSEDEIFLGKRWIDEETCRRCKGVCCQRNACDNAPSDFNNDFSLIEKALESGNYSIDFARTSADAFVTTSSGYLTLDLQHILGSYDETLYVHPRNKNRPVVDIIHTPEEEGPCIFWSLEKGCALSYEDRPMFGRAIIPSRLGPAHCSDVYYTRNMILAYWRPFTAQLYDLAKKYFSEDWELYQRFNFRL